MSNELVKVNFTFPKTDDVQIDLARAKRYMAAASEVVSDLAYAARRGWDSTEETLERMTPEERAFVFSTLQELGLLTHIANATYDWKAAGTNWTDSIAAIERAIKG